MIPVGYASKVKLLTAGITMAASNTRRFMLSRDRSKVMSEIEACRSFLDELEEMARKLPLPPNVRPGYGYDSVRPPN